MLKWFCIHICYSYGNPKWMVVVVTLAQNDKVTTIHILPNSKYWPIMPMPHKRCIKTKFLLQLAIVYISIFKNWKNACFCQNPFFNIMEPNSFLIVYEVLMTLLIFFCDVLSGQQFLVIDKTLNSFHNVWVVLHLLGR